MKVYELARELKMESKSLLAKLKLWGIHAPSHMATLDERTVAIVRQKIKKGEEAPEAPKKPILIKKKSVSPVTEILEGQPSQEEAILSSELPPSEVRTSVASQEPKISETAPQLSESLPPPIPPVENILPRIPVEGWTQESMPSRQAEKGVPAATSATPSKEAAEKGSARDRGAVGDKRGKPAKSVKEKTQKLDRLHMLRIPPTPSWMKRTRTFLFSSLPMAWRMGSIDPWTSTFRIRFRSLMIPSSIWV